MTPQILPEGTLALGLGCSRLGSLNGASGKEARAILHLAVEQGIRFFDTANIYAQGDSERYLGEILAARSDCVICSKGGKYLTIRKKIFVPLKGVLRSFASRSEDMRSTVARVRSRPMPTRWDSGFLTRELEASLKRLRRERIDIYMLHSPAATVLERGDAVEALEAARLAGKIGCVGASVDDPEAARAALADPRVWVLQLPLHAGDTAYDAVLAEAASRGVAIVAREILGGQQAISGTLDVASSAEARVRSVIGRPDIAVTLIGTTKAAHLRQAVAAARSA